MIDKVVAQVGGHIIKHGSKYAIAIGTAIVGAVGFKAGKSVGKTEGVKRL